MRQLWLRKSTKSQGILNSVSNESVSKFLSLITGKNSPKEWSRYKLTTQGFEKRGNHWSKIQIKGKLAQSAAKLKTNINRGCNLQKCSYFSVILFAGSAFLLIFDICYWHVVICFRLSTAVDFLTCCAICRVGNLRFTLPLIRIEGEEFPIIVCIETASYNYSACSHRMVGKDH